MALESSDYFRITRMAYTTGLMQKIIQITDHALDAVFQELGMGPYEMFDCLDRTEPDPVEHALRRTPPLLVRLAARPALMKAAAFALDRPAIRNKVQEYAERRFRNLFEAAMKNAAQPGEASQ